MRIVISDDYTYKVRYEIRQQNFGKHPPPVRNVLRQPSSRDDVSVVLLLS